MIAVPLAASPRTASPESRLASAIETFALEPDQRPAFMALQGQLQSNEIAYRRARLRGATRFFGLDIHKEYALASAVDGELNFVYGPVTVTWERFPAWIKKTLTKEDAVTIEMTTSAP
jgi:hypothetical protein